MNSCGYIGGQTPAPGWEIMNVLPGPHVDHLGNANDLSRFPDASLEAIYSSHTLEHFDYQHELMATLKEWHRALGPFGTLYVSVPDLDVLAELFLDKTNLTVNEHFMVMRMMFGGHTDPHDYHGVGLNADFLVAFLEEAGFSLIRKVDEFRIFQDCSSMRFKDKLISLNVVARKLPSQATVTP